MLDNHQQVHGELSYKGINKEKRDLLVLKYMAQKVRITVLTSEQGTIQKPLRYMLEERHGRIHRMVLYNPQALLSSRTISFVGFVSGQQKIIDPEIEEELHIADAQLANELAHIPGFLGYCSLELRAGYWYNLVLLNDADVKGHLLTGETHKYAAHHLAPRYYEWIRLHSGKIEGGLLSNHFVVQRTKFYMFPGGLQSIEHKPTINE